MFQTRMKQNDYPIDR